jgi:hypothetical protein
MRSAPEAARLVPGGEAIQLSALLDVQDSLQIRLTGGAGSAPSVQTVDQLDDVVFTVVNDYILEARHYRHFSQCAVLEAGSRVITRLGKLICAALKMVGSTTQTCNAPKVTIASPALFRLA